MIRQITAVYRSERERLLAYIRRRVSDLAEAEDILQSVFYSALEAIDGTGPIENVTGWIYTITRNRIIDWYRSRKTGNRYRMLPEESGLDFLIDEEDLPDEPLLREEMTELVLQGIQTLPPAQKQVFTANLLDGRTLQQIADENGEPLGTILSRKRYALLSMRKFLLENM